jgi:peptide-methionine (R)-S-oxide reductase
MNYLKINAKFELDKFDPNYGWPSFDKPVNRENIELREDNSFGMHRTEVLCKNCGSHLGHLFNDRSNSTTGEDYCVNGCALTFKPKHASK